MYLLREIITLARERAPFYADLYRNLPADAELPELPIINATEYWEAHREDRQAILTGPLVDGVVLNSGGTTGLPKFSYFNDAEWDDTVEQSAKAFTATGLQDGDRVANLFAAGDLYSSFILATESLKAATPRVLQFPLAYSMNYAAVTTAMRGFGINVLAGFPTHLLRVIDYLDRDLGGKFDLRRILFAGELFSQDQRAFLEARFPGISIRSVGYATIDAGLIGYADDTCDLGVHRVFDGKTIVEIVDEDTDEVIETPGQPGRVIFTSCMRRLMPTLRYPTGDRGEWVDAEGTPDRRFTLLGRSEEAARVASYSLPVARVREALAPFRGRFGLGEFQLVVTREDLLDRLTVRLVGEVAPGDLETGSAEILAAFERDFPDLTETVQGGIMHPIRLEWVRKDELIVSERTGKLRVIVDRRAG